ncbi:MAG: tetratricopeptide repeat protein, partial [Candidatus Acidiferrales bacterium]
MRTQPTRLLLLAAILLVFSAASLRAQDETSPFQVTRYEIDAELLPEPHQLLAKARLEIRATQSVAAVNLLLNKNLKVERVLDAQGKPLAFEHATGAESFAINFPQALASGSTTTVSVEYGGVLDPALRPEQGPKLAAIAPGQSYLLRESRWYPQAVNRWERYAMTLTVTVPEGETALTSGRADAPATLGGKTRTVFRTAEATLAGTLVAGRYEKLTPAAGAPIAFYLRSLPAGYASANADKASDILAFFSDRFGALSNPSVAIVEAGDDSWEAYAAPNLLLLPPRQWSSSISPRLLARGLAAQWWAARISPATTGDAWLGLGLARYCEALYMEHAAGPAALEQVLEDLTITSLVDEAAAPIANAGRLAPFSPEFNSVVRDKGAMVFQMLRVVMGDEPFARLLTTYSQRFAGRAVTLEEFERLAEEIHGQPLDYFFSEWLRSTGVPQFEVDWVIYRTQKGFRVTGQLKQQLEIFRMPIPVHVETEGPPVTQLVEVVGPQTDFSIETFGKPTRIEIDPDFTVLKYTPALRLRVAIARGESLFERGQYFEAAREYQRALEIKRNSSLAHYRLGETYFSQRNYQSAANTFREALNGDRDPAWTVVWSHIFLGKIFDISGQRERAVNEYRRALETKDDNQGALA